MKFSKHQSHTFYSTLSNGLDAAIFLVMIAIGRFLGDEDFGKFSFAQSIAVVFISWGSFGLNPIVIRNLSRDNSRLTSYIRAVIPWTALLTLVAFVLMAVYLLVTSDDSRLILVGIIVGLATMFRYLTMTFRAFSQSLGRFDVEFRNVFAENLLLIPLCLAVLLAGYGIVEVALALIFSRLIGMLIQTASLRRIVGEYTGPYKPDWSLALKLQKNAVPIGAGLAIAMLIINIDTLLLSYISSFAQVGLYNASLKLYAGLMIIPSIANAVLSHHIARASTLPQATREFWRGSIILFFVACTILLILGPYSSEIITLLYGSSYEQAGDVFFWHLVACIPTFQVFMLRTYFISIGKSRTFLVMTLFGLILRVILFLTIVPTYGLVSAAQVAFVAELITYLASIAYIQATHRSNRLSPETANDQDI